MRLAGAIDIGGTNIKLGIVDENGAIVKRDSVPTSRDGEPSPLVDAIVASLRPMIVEASRDGNAVSGIGVSVAGFLDPGHLGMIHNANLVAAPRIPVAPRPRGESRSRSAGGRLECRRCRRVPTRLGRGAARLLGVTLGTGLGGGVIIDGQLLRFTGECAGDIGHIIVDPDGRMCTCGARGCLEAMVNVAALSERGGGRAVRDTITSARRGDQVAVKALSEMDWGRDWNGVAAPLSLRT